MKTPLALANVISNKKRTAASLAGVTFAIMLLFMQLGFYDVCYRSSTMLYDQLDFDIALVSPQYAHLRAANTFPKRRLAQARATPGVASAPLYVSNGLFRNPQSRSQREIVVMGVAPEDEPFKLPALRENVYKLKKNDTAIMDSRTGKGYDKVLPGLFTELDNHKIELVGSYAYGSGFISDASIVVSDRTLSRVYNGYPLESVTIGLVKVAPDAEPEAVVRTLRAALPSDVKVWTRADLEASEQYFFVRLRPLGIMFSSGVLLAFAVGAVILYQVLSSEITNKLKEYATLKAMGYSNAYMNKVVLQQANLFRALGYVPAALMSLFLYHGLQLATNLPMTMTWTRVIFVLVLSVAMCSGSGFSVSLKVARTDPAELF